MSTATEKKQAWTPGPWFVAPGDNDIIHPYFGLLASTMPLPRNDPAGELEFGEATQANAKLIAKAPEMAAMLIGITTGHIPTYEEVAKILSEAGVEL